MATFDAAGFKAALLVQFPSATDAILNVTAASIRVEATLVLPTQLGSEYAVAKLRTAPLATMQAQWFLPVGVTLEAAPVVGDVRTQQTAQRPTLGFGTDSGDPDGSVAAQSVEDDGGGSGATVGVGVGVALIIVAGLAYFYFTVVCRRRARAKGPPAATAIVHEWFEERCAAAGLDITSQRESTAVADDLTALEEACATTEDKDLERTESGLESSKMMRELEGLQLSRCRSFEIDEPTASSGSAPGSASVGASVGATGGTPESTPPAPPPPQDGAAVPADAPCSCHTWLQTSGMSRRRSSWGAAVWAAPPPPHRTRPRPPRASRPWA